MILNNSYLIKNLFLVIFIFCEIIKPIRGCSMGYDELGIVLSNAILSDFDKKIKYSLSLEEC